MKIKKILPALIAAAMIFVYLPFTAFAQNIISVELTFDDSYSQGVQINSSSVQTVYINKNVQKVKVQVASTDANIWINGNQTDTLEISTTQNVTEVSVRDNAASYTLSLVKETAENIGRLIVKSYAGDSLIENIEIADFNENNEEYFVVVSHNTTNITFHPALTSSTSFEVVGYEGREHLELKGKETVFQIVAGEKSFNVTVVLSDAPAVFDSVKTIEITALNSYNSIKLLQTHNYGKGEYKVEVPLSTEKIKLSTQLYNDKEALMYCGGELIEQNQELTMNSDSLTVTANCQSGEVAKYTFEKTAAENIDIQNFYIDFYDVNNNLICSYSKINALQSTDIILPSNYSYAVLNAEFGGFVKNIECDGQKISLPYKTAKKSVSLDVEFDDKTSKSFDLNFVSGILSPKLEYAYISFYDIEFNPINEILLNTQSSITVPKRAEYFTVSNIEADYDFGLSLSYNGSSYETDEKIKLADGQALKLLNGNFELKKISLVKTQAPNSQLDITEGLIIGYNSHSVMCYEQYFELGESQNIVMPFDTAYFAVYFNAQDSDSVITLESKKAAYSEEMMYFATDFKEKSYNFKITADSGNEYDFILNLSSAEKAGTAAELYGILFDFYDSMPEQTDSIFISENDIKDNNIVLLPENTSLTAVLAQTKENALCEMTLGNSLTNGIFYVDNQSKLKITVVSEDRRSVKAYEFEFTSNNYLSSLSVNSQSVTDFDKEKLEYSVTVEADVENAQIEYALDDTSASVVLSGNSNLSYGKNTFTVTVTGWDNVKRVYTLNIVRLSSSIVSSVYTVDEENMLIYNLKDKLPIETFIENLSVSGAQIEVLNTKGEKVTTGNIATGMTVNAVYNDNVLISYTVLIYGDVNGDGNINAIDNLAIVQHSFGTSVLSGVKLLAGNANRDQEGKVNAIDILAIVYHSFGKAAIKQD